MHVMLALETMGNGPNAAIIAIGAVRFDPARSLTLGATFYRTVDLESSVRAGGEIDPGTVLYPGTVLWWLHQSDGTRYAITHGGVQIQHALSAFSAWLHANADADKTKVWGNGAAFDCVILAQAYRAAMKTPESP